MAYYSQNDEEKYIINYLKVGKPGRFLDIGAYDGKTFSNTYKLVELGWGGVCIEPSPSIYPSLEKLHQANHLIKTINAAVGDTAGTANFYDSGGDAISTFNLAHKQKWERNAHSQFKQVLVQVTTVAAIVESHGLFEFLNLDVEACNLEVFKTIPPKLLGALRLICIEHDSHIQTILDMTKPHGFREITRNGENLILGK